MLDAWSIAAWSYLQYSMPAMTLQSSFVLSQNGLFTNNGSKKKIKAVVEESKLGVTPKASKEDSKHQQNSAIKQPSFNASTPVTKPPASAHNQIFSPPNFTNISAIKKKEEVRDVRRMLATPEGTE